MQLFDIMVVGCVATAVAYTAVIYVKRDLVLAFGSIAASVIGTAGGSYLAFWYLPMHDQLAMILGGLFGGVALVGCVWYLRRSSDV